MANAANTPITRPGWSGANDDVDIHIEEHLGLVDKAFMYSSKFAAMMNIRSLRGTNTLRLDRLGAASVSGRKSGETLNPTKVKNDKWTLVVDTLLYVRNLFDKFDEWTTNLDTRREYAEAHGIALAKQFDQACLIAAAKCADFTVPSGMEGAFHDGIKVAVSITSNEADAEANASKLVTAHRKSIESLVKRDLGDQVLSEGVTFITPELFSVLLEHKKLLNVEYQGGNAGAGNDYARARIAMLNGIKVVETPRIPTEAITSNPLGDAFNVTADEAKRQIITIIPSLSLVAAQVAPINGDYWEWKEEFSWVLDSYQAYNIGQRRPDSVAVVEVTVTA